jgi:hypothetical protein
MEFPLGTSHDRKTPTLPIYEDFISLNAPIIISSQFPSFYFVVEVRAPNLGSSILTPPTFKGGDH